MTPEQVVDLLSAIAARDRRTVGKADVIAWHTDVGDLPFDDALTAVSVHFRESTDWMLPAHLRRIVHRIRADRLGPPGPGLTGPPPPVHPDEGPAAYLAALRAQQARIADGSFAPALPAGDETPGYDNNPHVEKILAQWRAEQEAAERRKAQQDAEEREALAVYRDAVDELLALPDRGATVLARARAELLSDEQAAQGFPLRAATPGVLDDHKIAVHAAWLASQENRDA